MSATNLYLTAYANNATVLAQAVAAYPLRDVRYLLGEYDTCNCNTAGYANPHGYCYPAATAAACSPNADGGSLSGRGCCDTYPDSNTSNALAVGCEALLQARGACVFLPTTYYGAGGHLPTYCGSAAHLPPLGLTLIRGVTGCSAAATTSRTCNRSLLTPCWSTPPLPAATTTATASSRTR